MSVWFGPVHTAAPSAAPIVTYPMIWFARYTGGISARIPRKWTDRPTKIVRLALHSNISRTAPSHAKPIAMR